MDEPSHTPGTAYDVIVVGAGAAGICAAVEAAGAGLDVLVLEAFPDYGGAAATSGGGCCIVGTPLQRENGITDSVELAFQDWMAWGGEAADAAWARQYLEGSRTGLYDWLSAFGVEWDYLEHQEGNTVPRWHHPHGGGQTLMRRLYEHARTLPGIAWRFSTPATRLLVDGGAVRGVATEAGELAARAVVVASGGFNNNPEMLRRLLPDPGPGSRLLCGGARTALGKGHALLDAVGADFCRLEVVWCYPYGTPDYLDEGGSRGIAVRGIEHHEIWVNAQGRRFFNESRRTGSGTAVMLRQEPATCWAVFDGEGYDHIRLVDPQYRQDGERLADKIEVFMRESPFVHRGETLEALAGAVGLPAADFASTVARWNAILAAGGTKDPDFDRPLAGLHPLVKPPFHAVQFFPMARKNFGGVRTDLQCRVHRASGGTIAGLYAAGEVAGMAGGHINGDRGLEGTMLGPSLYSGRVAGRAAAADLGRSVLPPTAEA